MAPSPSDAAAGGSRLGTAVEGGRRRVTRTAAATMATRSITTSFIRVRERNTGTGTTTSLRTRYPSRDSTTATSTVSEYL